MSSECRFSAGFWLAALRIIPRAERRGVSLGGETPRGRSARPDEGVIGLALEEVGVDRRREGRIVELDRVILGVLLRGSAPRGTYLDVADQHPQVRGLVVGRLVGWDEAGFDVERE